MRPLPSVSLTDKDERGSQTRDCLPVLHISCSSDQAEERPLLITPRKVSKDNTTSRSMSCISNDLNVQFRWIGLFSKIHILEEFSIVKEHSTRQTCVVLGIVALSYQRHQRPQLRKTHLEIHAFTEVTTSVLRQPQNKMIMSCY